MRKQRAKHRIIGTFSEVETFSGLSLTESP